MLTTTESPIGFTVLIQDTASPKTTSADESPPQSCHYTDPAPSAAECFRQCPFLMYSTIVTSCGGILFGFDTAALNGILIMPSFISTMGGDVLDNTGWANRNSWITSSLLLGAAACSPFAAVVADNVGRKTSINISSVIICVGACIQTGANSWQVMIFGRVIVGAGVGMLSAIIPIYLAEVSPKSIRGAVSSMFEVTVAVGILLAFSVNWLFTSLHGKSVSDSGKWRLVLGIQAALAICLSALLLPLPESPKWLVSMGRRTKARAVLDTLRKKVVLSRTITESEDALEVTNIDLEYEEICRESDAQIGQKTVWYDFTGLIHPSMLLRTSIGINIKLFQQLTGINSIMYYSSTIFSSIGIKPDTTTAITGLVNVIATVLSVLLIEKCGRRALLVWGSAGMCISLLLVGTIVLGTDPSAPIAAGAIAFLICFFITNFAYSYGPIAWLYPAEIFPMSIRAKGVSMSTSSDWFANFGVSKLVPLMILPGSIAGGLGGTFLIFGLLTFLTVLWGLSHIHETAHLSPEEIEEVFTVGTLSEYWKYVVSNCSYACYYGEMSMLEFTRKKKECSRTAVNQCDGSVGIAMSTREEDIGSI